MDRITRLVTSLATATAVISLAHAQVPPTAQPAQSNDAQPKARIQRRSIVQHYPLPYPEYYHGDSSAGFRNPGQVGRYTEYYPPGNQFQEQGDPVRVAKFDQGGGAPNRAEQLQALQIGVQRDNSIMNNINSYARPSFGVGFFGGFY